MSTQRYSQTVEANETRGKTRFLPKYLSSDSLYSVEQVKRSDLVLQISYLPEAKFFCTNDYHD